MGIARRSFRSVPGLSVVSAAAIVALSLALSASAGAAAELNVTGTWSGTYHCAKGPCAGQEKSGVFVLNQAAGSSAVTGTLNVTGGGEGSVSGTVSGNTLQLEGKGSAGYTASGVETISEDQLSWSGSYSDSAGTSGTLTATRPSLPVFPSSPTLRAAAIEVLCNLQVAFSNFTCTAKVGDASGASPATIPTGTVAFTAPAGAFEPLPQCALLATPGSSNVASCSVVYRPAAKIPTGTPAPVTGAYSGDSVFAASAAKAGAGPVVSPIVGAASSTGEGASTTVSCPAGATSCPIAVSLSVEESGGAVIARKAKRVKIVIGSTKLTLKGGQKRTVAVSLNRAGRKLLAKHRRFTALLKVTSGGSVVKTQRVQIKSKRHK